MGDAPGRELYLDHAASTPTRPEVLAAAMPYLGVECGNPTGSHRAARRARAALDAARDEIAELCGAPAGSVVFTSGGTEADNLAISGVLLAREDAAVGQRVLTSPIEHAAILEPLVLAAKRGVVVDELRVDTEGVIDLSSAADLLDPSVVLISVMGVNNEVGAIEPIVELAALRAERAPEAVLHCDAIQVLCCLDPTIALHGADLLSVSGHKLGGFKGSGALVLRRSVPLESILRGGGQEQERRSGTHNVAGAVALAAAMRIVTEERDRSVAIMAERGKSFEQNLMASLPDTVRTVSRGRAVPSIIHLRFAGVDQQELLIALDQRGVCVTGGASCASGALEASHVLAAMGIDPAEARAAIRFSLSPQTTSEDLAEAAARVVEAVEHLRR